MHICGGGTGSNGLAWYGVIFDNRAEAEKVMKFLEKNIAEPCKVDSKQTEEIKGEQNVGKD
jgi:uncharacterized protein YfcZ (UPF0381/DUF406 family)